MEAQTTERSEFLAERQRGIGGSDAPVILELSTFKTPLGLWMEKTGRTVETADNAILRRGRRLEPVVIAEYQDETGRAVTPGGFRTHEKFPWLIGHLDGLTTGRETEGFLEGVLECKSANAFRVSAWEDEAPLVAQVQLQHYLAVTGLPWGSIAGLLGGLVFRYQDIERNEEFIGQMLEREAEFWRLVETDTPPEPTAQDAKAIGQLYASVTGESVHLPPESAEWDRRRLEASAEIKRLEEIKAEAENKLKFAIGHAEAGILPDGAVYTFKTQSRAEHVVKASTFRVLRRAKK